MRSTTKVLQNSRFMCYSRHCLTGMTLSRPRQGKTFKFATKAYDRQERKLHEFVRLLVLVVRQLADVLSQLQTRKSDSATRLRRKIVQLWLSWSFKVIQPHWAAVSRSRLQFSRTPFCLLQTVPVFQQHVFSHSPCSVS